MNKENQATKNRKIKESFSVVLGEPVYTAIDVLLIFEHATLLMKNMQTLLMKTAALTTIKHHHKLNNSKQHTCFDTHQG